MPTLEQFWDADADEIVNRRTGARLRGRHDRLMLSLPEDAMPARPRGDAKERTFNLLIRDGVDDRESNEEKLLIGESRGAEDGLFGHDPVVAEDLRPVFGQILDDHYVVEGRGGARFLFPFQTFLPATFEFKGRYKMFNGKILAFLAQPERSGNGFDSDLIQEFFDLFNGVEELTLLDQRVLAVAQSAADGDGAYRAESSVLLDRYYEGDKAPGALLPDAHRRFQEDLKVVLGIRRLNRKDKVNAAINVLYLHLGLYFQRLAWLLEEEFARALEAIRDPTIGIDSIERCFQGTREDSPFAGSIQFRVGSGRPQPVKMADGLRTTYVEQNRRQLLLPVNLSVLGAAREVCKAVGVEGSSTLTFAGLVDLSREHPQLWAEVDEALTSMAVMSSSALASEDQLDIGRQVEASTPGLEVFRESLLKIGRSALRRHGRDIVHQLVHRGGRGYISSRGRIYFFELGQDLLLLLAKVIVRDEEVPYRRFLSELRAYGFEPQSRQEEENLAETLRALNLLEKHSDAGEAMYVKHFL